MLYIPPTQNPFLVQSMQMLQNIGMMYLGHSLKQEDTEKQQLYQRQLMNEEGQTKMQLAGYTPASGYDQAEAGGTIPSGQVRAYGQAYNRPEAKKPKFYDTEIEGVKLAQMIGPDGKTTWEVIKSPKSESEKSPTAFIQKYNLAKSQGYTGDIMQFQKDMYAMAAKANPAATPKPPNLQAKYKSFMKDGKYYRQDYNFDPKTGDRKEIGQPYEVPKTMGLFDMLNPNGGSGTQTSDAQMEALNSQIMQLQNALKKQEEE
jgi:hypothetical protein